MLQLVGRAKLDVRHPQRQSRPAPIRQSECHPLAPLSRIHPQCHPIPPIHLQQPITRPPTTLIVVDHRPPWTARGADQRSNRAPDRRSPPGQIPPRRGSGRHPSHGDKSGKAPHIDPHSDTVCPKVPGPARHSCAPCAPPAESARRRGSAPAPRRLPLGVFDGSVPASECQVRPSAHPRDPHWPQITPPSPVRAAVKS